MEDSHGGLGYAQLEVVDPKLAAGRGREFSAAYMVEQENARIEESIANDEEFRLPIDHRPQQPLRTEGITMASVDTPISDDNVGFRMLQRLGWKQGTGLGRDGTGRVDPIRGADTAGLRFGLGKAEQDSFYTSEDNITRKKLDSETMLEETEEQLRLRELKAEHQEKIKEDVKEELSTFYCKLCNKQYKFAMELETHLSSYDHHHKKRLQEMKQMQSERTKQDREKKEKRRMEKEMSRMTEQFQKAQQSAPQPPNEAPPPLPPPPGTAGSTDPGPPGPAPPAPASTERKAMAFSLGTSSGLGPGRGAAAGPGRGLLGKGKGGALTGRGRGAAPRGRGKPAAALAAFAPDSDSDD